jgi:hypothetical protein
LAWLNNNSLADFVALVRMQAEEPIGTEPLLALLNRR